MNRRAPRLRPPCPVTGCTRTRARELPLCGSCWQSLGLGLRVDLRKAREQRLATRGEGDAHVEAISAHRGLIDRAVREVEAIRRTARPVLDAERWPTLEAAVLDPEGAEAVRASVGGRWAA